MATGTMTRPMVVAWFDGRMWAGDFNGATLTLGAWQSADFWTAAAGAGTWTAGAVAQLDQAEEPVKLFTWQYPLDRGKATLWLLTTARLWYYDYYAATPAWHPWFRMATPHVNGGGTGDAVVSPRNGNLYVGLSTKEWLWEFTGNTIARLSWNKRQGLPNGRRLTAHTLGANESGVYAFCGPHPGDPTSEGAALFMDEGGNFHPLHIPTLGVVVGGGVGEDGLWVVDLSPGSGGFVVELSNPDTLAVPPHVGDRTYDAGAQVLVSGWLRMGLLNVNKRLLYFEVDCLKNDGTVGLNAGATVEVAYRSRTGTAWTSAGTLTAASTFPAVFTIAGGWSFKEMQYRLILTRGTTTGDPALVRALKLGFRPRPKQRYTYTVRTDLRDDAPAFAAPDATFHGLSAIKLRAVLDELNDNDDAGLDDTLVGLAYGGFGNLLHPRRRSVSQCELSIQAQEDPTGGDGLYLLTFNAIDAPSSG